MRLKLAFLLFAVLLPCAPSWAQTIQTQPNNTVSVSSDGTFETAPDTAVLQFDITSQDKTSSAAYSRLAKGAEAVRQTLSAKGIEVKSAELSRFSVHPIVEWKSGSKRKVIAYRLNTRVNLNIKDFSKIGTLMEALAAIDEVENQLVTYAIDNLDQAKKLAVENGLARAREMAETATKSSGRALGGLATLSVDTSVRNVANPYLLPYDYRLGMAMAGRYKQEVAETYLGENDVSGNMPSSAEFGSKSISITAHIRAVFFLQ